MEKERYPSFDRFCGKCKGKEFTVKTYKSCNVDAGLELKCVKCGRVCADIELEQNLEKERESWLGSKPIPQLKKKKVKKK